MAAEGMPFPRRWNGGTISTNLDVIWGMSAGEPRLRVGDGKMVGGPSKEVKLGSA